jgi:NAD+ synthase
MKSDADHVTDWIRTVFKTSLRKKGVVVPVSGGIDSTVTAHLMARALGPDKVVGLYMPERATASETGEFVRLATDGVSQLITIDITARLDAAGCYQQLDEVLAAIDPGSSVATHDFALTVDPGFAMRTGSLRFDLKIRAKGTPSEPPRTVRVPSRQLAALIGAQNLKQRTRMTTAYNLAESRRWAVAGTSNADEIEFGFVVKYGDHAGDLQPLGALAKADVYELAHQLGVPQEVIDRTPTTDTFSLEQTQGEYYYALSPDELRGAFTDVAAPAPVRQLAATLRRAGATVALDPIRFVDDNGMAS